MSDPAIDAAQRALNAKAYSVTCVHAATAAAREALKPIRAKYRELFDQATIDHGGASYPFPAGVLHALRELAPLIYSSEELDDEQP